MNALKISSVRENNKFKIYSSDEALQGITASYNGKDNKSTSSNSSAPKCIFEAETKGGLNFTASINASPFSGGSLFQGNKDLGQLGSIGMQMFGYAPQFDIPAFYNYQGSSPLNFEISCFLRLKTGIEEDYRRPLYNLCACFLPSMGKQNITNWIRPVS